MAHCCHFRLLLHPPSLLSRREGYCPAHKGIGRRLWAVAYTGGSVGYQDQISNVNSSAPRRIPLSSQELHKAALLARLSGLCYYPAEQLADKLESEGMKLITSGGTSFTRCKIAAIGVKAQLSHLSLPVTILTKGCFGWYVADGPLARKASLEGMSKDKNAIMSKKEMTSLPASETERVILLRGVVWQGKEVNAFKMWQDLMRFWPAPFAPEHTKKPDLLYAHAGVADMAGQLYEALRIPVTEAQALQRPCYFGGHSLGGSLALLLAVLFRLRLPLSPHLLQCCTFGSPPVLSHGGGGGGNGVVRMLGLPEGSMRSFVLENDPVPRALLSIDPTFTALKNSRPGAALLQLRHWLLGPGVPLTPDRFLADNIGEVNLLRWTPDSGHKVIPLEPGEMEEQLRMVRDEASATTFQGIVDHAHGSYSLDLDAAARQLEQEGL